MYAFLWIVMVYVVAASVLFVAAGQFGLPSFWAYIAVMAVLGLVAYIAVSPRIPEMMQEQKRGGVGEQNKGTGPMLVAMLIFHWIIAGVDVGRTHWSGDVPFVSSYYYYDAAAIQAERGQQVITTGPYHWVRHPGYVGWILYAVFSGIALGSWLSILPTLLIASLIVRRTIIEDKMLARDLKGYVDYARQVRYRLIPGLW